MRGGGGEMGELADPLMAMREAQDDMASRKHAVSLEAERKDEEKEKTGERLVIAASKCRNPANNGISIDVDEEYDGTLQRSPRKKWRIQGTDGKTVAFVEHMKEAELGPVNLREQSFV